jgi:DNA polymerase
VVARDPQAKPRFGGKWAAALADPAAELRALHREASSCEACGRCRSRGRVLLGEGGKAAVLVLTGAPSLAEDTEGRLFVGEAGTMLDRMLVHVLALERANVHVAAAAMCTGGELLPDEIEACRRWLHRRLAIVQPRIVLAMGGPAAQAVRAVPGKFGWSRYDAGAGAVDVYHTLHPQELLERPSEKRLAMEHLREVRARLG